jgi:hypothetical protein
VGVYTETAIVGQIPTHVVRIIINHDWIRIPEPAAAKGDIEGRNTPSPAIEPEAAWTATAQMPDMTSSNAAGEATVLPRMIEMIIGVVTSCVMTNPLTVVVNVRRFRVAFAVGVTRLRSLGVRISRRVRSRSMSRDETAAYSTAATMCSTAVFFAAMLGQSE